MTSIAMKSTTITVKDIVTVSVTMSAKRNVTNAVAGLSRGPADIDAAIMANVQTWKGVTVVFVAKCLGCNPSEVACAFLALEKRGVIERYFVDKMPYFRLVNGPKAETGAPP